MTWCELCGPDWCETNEIRVADELMITSTTLTANKQYPECRISF